MDASGAEYIRRLLAAPAHLGVVCQPFRKDV